MPSAASILKQAYHLVRTNRFLWVFGLFLFWGNSLNFLNFTADPNNSDYQNSSSAAAEKWLVAHPELSLIIFVVLLACIAGLIYLYFRSRAGLILSVKNILEKKEVSFRKGFKEGRFFCGRLFKLSVLINLVILVVAGVLMIPVLYLLSIGYPTRAAILGLFGALIFVPIYAVSLFVSTMAPMFTVLYNMNVRASIAATLDMVRERWVILLMFSLTLFGVTILVVIASILGVLAITIPFVLLTRFIYHTEALLLAYATMSVGMIAAAAIFLIVQSAMAAFQQSAWVLMFEELVKPRNSSVEAEAEVVPEVVS